MLTGRLAAAVARAAHALLAPALVVAAEVGARRAAAAAAAAATPSLELAGVGPVVGHDVGPVAEWLAEWRRRRAARAVDDADGDDAGPASRAGDGDDGVLLMAVPKRKPSYRKKRLRQMNPLYRNEDLQVRAARCDGGCDISAVERHSPISLAPSQSFYPCPKCDKGLLKLRHHLCPCDQEALNLPNVVRVAYPGAAKAASGGAGGAGGAGAASGAAAAATASAGTRGSSGSGSGSSGGGGA